MRSLAFVLLALLLLFLTSCDATDSSSTKTDSLPEPTPLPTRFSDCIGDVPAYYVGSIEYGKLRALSTNTHRGGWPYAIVRPHLALGVARAVKCAVSAGLKVCGRSGVSFCLNFIRTLSTRF